MAPLTDLGRAQADALAAAISRAALPARVITSGYARTNETAAPISRALGLSEPPMERNWLYDKDPTGLDNLDDLLSRWKEPSIVVVAHLPFVNAYASHLVKERWGQEPDLLGSEEYGAGFYLDLLKRTQLRLPRPQP